MKRATSSRRALVRANVLKPKPPVRPDPAFHEIVTLIREARQHTFQVVNVALIDLYWGIGARISRRVEADGWGKSTVASLAAYIRRPECPRFLLAKSLANAPVLRNLTRREETLTTGERINLEQQSADSRQVQTSRGA